MQIYGSPVLNSFISLVILLSVGNLVMEWRERLLMWEMAFCRFFQNKSAIRGRGQFWQGIAANRNYQDISSILRTFWDWFMAIMRKYNDQAQKELQRKKLNLLVRRRQCKTIYSTCTLKQWGKRHLKI